MGNFTAGNAIEKGLDVEPRKIWTGKVNSSGGNMTACLEMKKVIWWRPAVQNCLSDPLSSIPTLLGRDED
jgi:hypothetical protein